MYKVLAINPGSTSTKIAVYEDEDLVFRYSIDHTAEELEKYPSIYDQYEMRYERIVDSLEKNNIKLEELNIVVGRGGPVAPLESGAYLVDEVLVDKLKNDPMIHHASNLGGIIAYELSKKLGIDALIYDAVSTDELEDIARLSGVKEIERRSLIHALNMRASAIKVAKSLGKNYTDLNLIVAHLGGGLSISIHRKGRMVDIVSDDEGAFSPERAGVLPSSALMEFCYKNDKATVAKLLRGKGGLVSYLGTNDAREVEKMIEDGDEYAKLVYEALAYQVAKSIGQLATVVNGQVDGIILTGGMAYSKLLTGWIEERVKFISKVIIVPGENELEALAMGGLRVLRGEERVHRFVPDKK
ncbi:MAG: butyrate kinase [Tissierellia bacterium]|nr:butyrate kinase [Tissierellia bacterium]